MRPTTVVVPCYNEADRLPVDEFREFLERRTDIGLLFVDDGSRDRTREVIEALAASVPDGAYALGLDVNGGKAEAVRQGVQMAAADPDVRITGYWDADLATPLRTILAMREALEASEECHMMLGSRVMLLGRRIDRHASRHYLGRIFATAASMALALPVYDTQCGAKLLRVDDQMRGAFDEQFSSRWIFDVELIARLRRVAIARGIAVDEFIHEYPLDEWTDVDGSKVKPFDFVKSAWELVGIRRRYPPQSAD